MCRLSGCPVDANIELKKHGRGSLDHRCNANSGIIFVKLVDNSVVKLESDIVCIETISEIVRYSDGVRKK